MKFSPDRAFRSEACTRCGSCGIVCPSGAIRSRVGEPPLFIPDRCIGCGHCASVCPADAFSFQCETGRAAGAGETMELFRRRRSIRFFRPEQVPDEVLRKLLEPVGYSPTGVNACGLRVACFRGPDVAGLLFEPLRRFLRPLWKCGLLRLGAAAAGMSGQVRRLLEGEDLVFRGAPLVLVFLVPRRNPTWRSDAAIAASLVMIQAQALGLGSLWNGVAEKAWPLVREWHRPAGGAGGLRAGAILCVGYAAMEMKPIPPRDWLLVEAAPGRPAGDPVSRS